MASPQKPLIASIEEDVRFTFGGAVCVFMMVVVAIGAVLGVVAAKGAFQEAAMGAMAVAAFVAFGVGVIVGRRRTYRVYRELPPE